VLIARVKVLTKANQENQRNAHKNKCVFDNQGSQIANTIAVRVGTTRSRNKGKQPVQTIRREQNEERQGRGQPVWRKEIHVGNTIYRHDLEDIQQSDSHLRYDVQHETWPNQQRVHTKM
jgi:hypothetical protein